MTTAPFLYVCVRPQENAAAAEYESFRTSAGLEPTQLDRIDLVRERLPVDFADRYRGVMIGGSPFNVTDPDSTKTETQLIIEAELAAVAQAGLAARVAVMFTCYGIGVAVRELGGEVTRGFPEDTGPTTIALTAAAAVDPIFGPLSTPFTALTAHKEGSGELPQGATLLATNPACPVQAFRAGSHLYATQFHPEPTGHAFTDRMAIYREDGYFDSADFDLLAERVLSASITQPLRILRGFASVFGG